MDESCNLYELESAKGRLSQWYTDLSLECSMTHHPTILWAGIIPSPENLVCSISDTVRWWRLAGSDSSRPLSRPLPHHYLHPHFIRPKCDWWECPAWPGTVSWHTAEGKDSCERGRGEEGGGRGEEGGRIWTLSVPLQISGSRFYTYIHKSKVVTLDNMTRRQPRL